MSILPHDQREALCLRPVHPDRGGRRECRPPTTLSHRPWNIGCMSAAERQPTRSFGSVAHEAPMAAEVLMCAPSMDHRLPLDVGGLAGG